MHFDTIQIIKQLVSLLVVLAPLDVMPLYLSLTHCMSGVQRHRILVRMIVIVLLTLLFFPYGRIYIVPLLRPAT